MALQGADAARLAPDADAGAARGSTPLLRRLPRRGWGRVLYPVAAATAAAAVWWMPLAQPSADPAYLFLGCALLVGALLTVRLRPGAPGTALLIVPALVAHERFGAAALPALAYAVFAAAAVRREGALTLVGAVAHDVLAFAGAHLASEAVPDGLVLEMAVFAGAFAGLRTGLWWLAAGLRAPPAADPRAERPDLLLTLALSPLGLLPVLAGRGLGDGALLLVLAAVLALLFVVREATNLAVARTEVERERDRLAHARALQEDLIHLITHELKNPLTTVLAYAQLGQRAIKEAASPRLPAYLEQIERSGRTMERLVDNLLQLSRLEQGAPLPPAEEVDLDALARDTVAELVPLAESKHLTLEVEVADGDLRVVAPPLLVREALSNLVSNAVKYTPDDGQVAVWVRPGDEPATVVMGVTDTGIGLSDEDLARLFTKFFRSNNPQASKQRGSGLGLALTYAMVARMGGQLQVESQLNQGTTFRLVLPREQAA